jgi:hypothetical protein
MNRRFLLSIVDVGWVRRRSFTRIDYLTIRRNSPFSMYRSTRYDSNLGGWLAKRNQPYRVLNLSLTHRRNERKALLVPSALLMARNREKLSRIGNSGKILLISMG